MMFKARISAALLLIFFSFQNVSAHKTALHSSPCSSIPGNMTCNAIEICDTSWGVSWLNSTYKGEIYDGSWDEDNSALRYINHGYNPITGTTGGIFIGGQTAQQRAIGLWEDMEAALASGHLTGGDGVGAYHYLGRCCHLLQDMSTYPHIHPQDITGLPYDPINPEHQIFEDAEFSSFQNHDFPNTDPPLLPTDSLTGVSKSTEKLDPFSANRLLAETYSDNDIASFIDIVARICYFRSTFWGEVQFVSESGNGEAAPVNTTGTSFGSTWIFPQPNVLRTMFGAGNVRYINSFTDDYFEITDADSDGFTWKSTWDDQWFPCAGGTPDGHVIVGGSDPTDAGVRTTGRFHFTTPYEVDPLNYPDGTSFSNSSLGYYISYYSMLVGVRYNAALMGVGSPPVQRTLTIQSQNPSSGVTIQVSPNDENGNGDGSTTFSRIYNYGARVTLTAPAAVSGNTFYRWLKNGSDYSTNQQITVTAKDNDTYTAVYTSGSVEKYVYGGCVTSRSIGNSDPWPAIDPTTQFDYLNDPDHLCMRIELLDVYKNGDRSPLIHVECKLYKPNGEYYSYVYWDVSDPGAGYYWEYYICYVQEGWFNSNNYRFEYWPGRWTYKILIDEGEGEGYELIEEKYFDILADTVATPTFSPDGGTYTSPVNVTINCSTSGATIRYTTDGSTPTQSSPLYTSPVYISSTTTLKAKAWKTYWFPSGVKSANYTITGTVATPTFSPDGGTYTSPVDVTISCSTSGATIHYTTNGVDPTESDPVYTSPINISSTTTLKAKAWKSGWNPSGVKSANYTVVSVVLLYVDAGANGANNGTNWTNAFIYLQDALDFARNSGGDVNEIRVAQGVYTPDSNSDDPNGSGDRTATFQLINGVTIRGSYAGYGTTDPNARDIGLYETVLSGDLLGNDNPATFVEDLLDDPNRADNCYQVFYHPSGTNLDATAILDGFIITAGNANSSNPHNLGGGMFNWDNSNPTVTGCTFTGNSASNLGGGMINGGSNPTVTGCTFSGNGTGAGGWGGGMCNLYDSRPTVTSCTFGGNGAGNRGGGMFNWESSSPTVSNCTFSDNSAPLGGGMCNIEDCSPTVTGCTFSGNSATYGGGMNNRDYSSPTVTGCTFTGNSASNLGGGMYNRDYSSPTVSNCILWGDTATSGGNEIALTYSSTIDVDYSDVQGGLPGIYDDGSGNTINWGIGNIEDDPCFVDPNNDDYHLLPSSPCIDTGDPNYVAEANEVDIDGDARVIGGRIDMGADEYAYGELSDFNGDGIVNFRDFSILAYYWMDYLCSEPDWCEGSDFDESRYVDFGDLKTFAENWLWQAIWYSQ